MDWESLLKKNIEIMNEGAEDSIRELAKARDEQTAAYKEAYEGEKTKIAAERENRLRQAYAVRRNAEKDLRTSLRAQGAEQGAAESTLADLYREYRKERSAAHADHDASVSELYRGYRSNLTDLSAKYAQLIAELSQKRREQALKQAQFAYQSLRAEQETAKAGGSGGSSRTRRRRGSSKKPDGGANTGASTGAAFVETLVSRLNGKKSQKSTGADFMQGLATRLNG